MLTLLIGLFACNNTPVVSGTVQDIWNNPIEGAMVQMEEMATNRARMHKDNFF